MNNTPENLRKKGFSANLLLRAILNMPKKLLFSFNDMLKLPLALIALLTLLASCSSVPDSRETYFGYKPKKVVIVEVEKKESGVEYVYTKKQSGNEWRNPLSDTISESSPQSDGALTTVVKYVYYEPEVVYIPVVTPWWSYYSWRPFYYPRVSFYFGHWYDPWDWSYWYNPWYNYHPMYGYNWHYDYWWNHHRYHHHHDHWYYDDYWHRDYADYKDSRDRKRREFGTGRAIADNNSSTLERKTNRTGSSSQLVMTDAGNETNRSVFKKASDINPSDLNNDKEINRKPFTWDDRSAVKGAQNVVSEDSKDNRSNIGFKDLNSEKMPVENRGIDKPWDDKKINSNRSNLNTDNSIDKNNRNDNSVKNENKSKDNSSNRFNSGNDVFKSPTTVTNIENSGGRKRTEVEKSKNSDTENSWYRNRSNKVESESKPVFREESRSRGNREVRESESRSSRKNESYSEPKSENRSSGENRSGKSSGESKSSNSSNNNSGSRNRR